MKVYQSVHGICDKFKAWTKISVTWKLSKWELGMVALVYILLEMNQGFAHLDKYKPPKSKMVFMHHKGIWKGCLIWIHTQKIVWHQNISRRDHKLKMS